MSQEKKAIFQKQISNNKKKEGLNPQAMKLIPYHTGHFFRTVELTGIQTPLDSYRSKYWSILDSFSHTGENCMFWPVNLNRANTKKNKPKNHQFLSLQPLTTTSPITPMSPATSILSIAVPPPASTSSSSPLHFSVLCFSSTF